MPGSVESTLGQDPWDTSFMSRRDGCPARRRRRRTRRATRRARASGPEPRRRSARSAGRARDRPARRTPARPGVDAREVGAREAVSLEALRGPRLAAQPRGRGSSAGKAPAGLTRAASPPTTRMMPARARPSRRARGSVLRMIAVHVRRWRGRAEGLEMRRGARGAVPGSERLVGRPPRSNCAAPRRMTRTTRSWISRARAAPHAFACAARSTSDTRRAAPTERNSGWDRPPRRPDVFRRRDPCRERRNALATGGPRRRRSSERASAHEAGRGGGDACADPLLGGREDVTTTSSPRRGAFEDVARADAPALRAARAACRRR